MDETQEPMTAEKLAEVEKAFKAAMLDSGFTRLSNWGATYGKRLIAAARSAATASPAEVELREALKEAFIAGCTDAHNSIRADRSLVLLAAEHCEFGEAGDDYAASVNLAALAQPDAQASEGDE